jgi:hypothetical protein
MDALPGVPARTYAPVASVWCRQVDNEAESPGYTAIPDDFPGLRETLDSIRVVGNLTVNVADTHDYWDPDPSSTLSFYPNLFLYPAASGRYTCIGRMFLSTEDRPRLGMKTLVFPTAELLESGDFGGIVRRAHATMGGKSDLRPPALEPDPLVYQAVGEGFLFQKGGNEPVVVVASEQWDAAARLVLDLVGQMPSALVALGAFLVFPYFLPAGKVDLHEFSEQLPLALAVMRVPKGEAQGERHEKRIASWQEEPVALRDLTRPPSGRSKETIPLVLQYVRDHADEKIAEVARRVDAVELPRVGPRLTDPESASGKDHRKEMWRIGAAMETAALLLAKPKGRTVPVSGDAAKRANEYLKAEPSEPASRAPAAADVAAPVGVGVAAGGAAARLPAWLRPPPTPSLPSAGDTKVPVSTSVDPSLLPTGGPTAAPAAVPGPAPPSPPPSSPGSVPTTAAAAATATGSAVALDPRLIDARVATALEALEAKWSAAVDARLRESSAAIEKTLDSARADLAQRLAAVEARPIVDPDQVEEARATSESARAAAEKAKDASERALAGRPAELSGRLAALEARPVADPQAILKTVDARAAAAFEPAVTRLSQTVDETVRSTTDAWGAKLRAELKAAADEYAARASKIEEELRAALAAQLELEIRETQEQGEALRQEIASKVDEILQQRNAAVDQRRAKETRELEQRLGLLVDGRVKDGEARVQTALASHREKLAQLADERVLAAERRAAVEREARLAELTESHAEATAGLQVRMQSFVEQKLRENDEKARDQYLELLARLKADVEKSIAQSLASTPFNDAIRERVSALVASARAEHEKSLTAQLKVTEDRLQHAHDYAVQRLEKIDGRIQQKEADVAHLERTVRHELDEFERRLKVVNDHVLPMVRQTWLKVSQESTETTLKEYRREILEEVHNVEAELVQRTTELRDRIEGSIAQNGRLWLNMLRQLSQQPEMMGPLAPHAPATAPSARSGAAYRRAVHRPVRTAPVDIGEPAFTPPVDPPFGDDPPNPMDPQAGAEYDPRTARRRPRRD